MKLHVRSAFKFADLPSTCGHTMATCSLSSRHFLGTAAFVAASVHAQTTTFDPVTITGTRDPAVHVGGWGDVPLSRLPFQAGITSSEQMRERGVQRLSDLARIDPGVSDAYNAEGYWDTVSVRGYVLDNRYNYRRDGLPINAETRIPLDNKERFELLKGTSGLQAGTSSPGGLVNVVVKRPTEDARRDARLEWRQAGSALGAVDLSERFGGGNAFGLRFNLAAERLDPLVRHAAGRRHVLALAGDWRVAPGTLIEAEVEHGRQSQPSVPGFSLHGDAVPTPMDPRINLNNQPWSLPVVFDAATASLRLSQRLGEQWRASVHAATQRLKSDDRIAFPFGCSAEGNSDRFCSDGTFDLYDFRSENERRRTDALEVALHGMLHTGPIAHDIATGVQRSRVSARFQGQAFNFAGTGNVNGTWVTPAEPTLGPAIADRDESSTEFFARDAIALADAATAWVGLRHTRLVRGTADASYVQDITTPWLAVSRELAPGRTVYASWGEGVESAVTPNLPSYGTAAGRPLPALKSRQFELGAKGQSTGSNWSLAWFDIERPVPTDTGSEFFIDGHAHHRGLDANAGWQIDGWMLQGGVQLLRARREGSQVAAFNGKRPTNVPAATLKLHVERGVPVLPGLSVQAGMLAESNRIVLPDNSARIPGYGRFDAGVKYVQTTQRGAFTWRAGLDNVFDRRAWKEAPYQFGHAYLFPLSPRTLRLSLEAAL